MSTKEEGEVVEGGVVVLGLLQWGVDEEGKSERIMKFVLILNLSSLR